MLDEDFHPNLSEPLAARLRTTLDHQVLTPLTVIHGVALTLSRDDIEISDATRQVLVRSVLTESERLQRTISELLSAIAVAIGSVTLRTARFNLDRLARDRVATWASHEEAPHIHFRSDATRHEILGDPAQLEQVLDSVLDNAVKYSPPDAAIKLSVTRQGTTTTRPGCITVAVEDHGRGIPRRERDSVFVPLFRGDPDMREDPGGLGLSLFKARSVVRRMGGDMWAEDSPDGGARMVLTLPEPAGV